MGGGCGHRGRPGGLPARPQGRGCAPAGPLRRHPAGAIRRLLQRHRERHPLVRAPLPLGHRADPDVRREDRARLGGLHRGQPRLRPRAGGRGEARPDLPDPGLSPHDGAADVARARPRGADPPLLAHPVRREDVPPHAARRDAAEDPARHARRGRGRLPGSAVGRELPPVRPGARGRARRHPGPSRRGGRPPRADPVLPGGRRRAGDPGGGRERPGQAAADPGGEDPAVVGSSCSASTGSSPRRTSSAASSRSSSSSSGIRNGEGRSCSWHC